MPDSVAIVVDSAASLPDGIANTSGLYVVPMTLFINGKTYLDGIDITSTEFYRLLKESGDDLPKTSAPTPGTFLEAFRNAAESYDSIICLTVASRFSASAQSARTAAETAKSEMPNLRVEVIDSKCAAGAEALLAIETLRAAQSGMAFDEVRDVALRVIAKVRLLAFVDTMYYLWKSGRVPMIAHAGTSLLKIKPVFELYQGEIQSLARPRTRRRATDKLMGLMTEKVGGASIHASVMHANAPEDAEALRKRIRTEFDCKDLFVSEFTPVMGAHIGPGMMGVAFWRE